MTDDKHHIEITNPELIKRFVEGAMLQNLDNPERMLLKTLGDLVVSVEALAELVRVAGISWVMIPLGQPEHRQLKEAAEAARKLLASNEEKKDD